MTADLGTSVAGRAADVLLEHFWADLAGSCVCGWLPDGPRRSGRHEHARHVAERLAVARVLASGIAP